MVEDSSGARPSDQALVSDEAGSRLHPSGFDPSRKTFAFVKDGLGDAGQIGVAIVQADEESANGELVDFRLCGSRAEAGAYMRMYGIDLSNVVYRQPAIAIEAATAGETGTGSTRSAKARVRSTSPND